VNRTPGEFCRLVPLDRLGGGTFSRYIEATPDERRALAARFDLLALERLAATVRLIRQAGETIRLEAEFEAEFAQECVVTLEPVAGAVRESFALIYGALDREIEALDLDVDAPAFEPLPGDAIDIGEAVAQELSLVLPLFPRDPEAMIEADVMQTPDDSPFAALAARRKTQEE
jgi:uncharacterized metal-binding protein YceD (DUF177 family)